MQTYFYFKMEEDNINSLMHSDKLDSPQTSFKPVSDTLSATKKIRHQRHIYLNKQIEEDISIALNLLHHTDKPLLIMGQSGSGKSTYLQLMQENIAEKSCCACIKATKNTSEKQLLKKIVQNLHIHRKFSGSYNMQLFEGLINLTRQNKIVIILIDDCHTLPNKTLNFITDLIHDKSLPLSICLFANEKIQTRLSSIRPAMNAGINIHSLNIRPFNIKQSDQFMQVIFNNSGEKMPYMLTDVQIAKLHKQSMGLPGQLKHNVEKLFKPDTLWQRFMQRFKTSK